VAGGIGKRKRGSFVCFDNCKSVRISKASIFSKYFYPTSSTDRSWGGARLKAEGIADAIIAGLAYQA
jgi:hypothetical protein